MLSLPNLSFELPHWVYWTSLIAFPVLAWVLYRRQRRDTQETGPSLTIGYFLLITGGFVGLHRFYARNLWGFGYIPFFLAILYGNGRVRDSLNAVSEARRELSNAAFDVSYWQERLDAGMAAAAARLTEAQQQLTDLQAALNDASARFDQWTGIVGGLALVIAIWLLFDLALLPRLLRLRREKEQTAAPDAFALEAQAIRQGETMVVHDERPVKRQIEFSFTIDAINRSVGELVAYWSVIAVLVYYYEVIARYVFNSPTNWAHEGMFLMFGMQYLLAGGFALLNDSHVRVDIFYARLSPRAKAISDLLTSMFFFIFAGTILWTGIVFSRDAMNLWEVSFTEWGIQYWPVKLTIAIGGALLILQGVAKLARDVTTVVEAKN